MDSPISMMATRKLRRMDVVEEELTREQLEKHTTTLLPAILLFLGLAGYAWRSDDRLCVPALVIGMLIGFCFVVLRFVGRASGLLLESRVRMAEKVCLAVRVLIHIVCILYDGGDGFVFLKIVSLWWLPFGFPKACEAHDSFRVFLAAHNLLVLCRFWGNLPSGMPWLVSTVIMDKMLLDVADGEHAQLVLRRQLAEAAFDLEKVAEATTQRMFQRFCDATVCLNSELQLAEPAPQLASLLGLSESQMKGRLFTSLVDSQDLARFQDHMARTHEGPAAPPDGTRPEVSDYIRLSLMDAYANAVPVHIFHTRFAGLRGEPVYHLGVSETWRPPKTKKSRPSSGTARSTPVMGSLGGGDDDGTAADPAVEQTSLPAALGRRGSLGGASKRRSYSPRPGARPDGAAAFFD